LADFLKQQTSCDGLDASRRSKKKWKLDIFACPAVLLVYQGEMSIQKNVLTSVLLPSSG